MEEEGTLPSPFCEADVPLIPKSDEDRTKTSYRAMSLTTIDATHADRDAQQLISLTSPN